MKKSEKKKPAKAAFNRGPIESVSLENGKATISVELREVPQRQTMSHLYYLSHYSKTGEFDGSLADAKVFVAALAAAITKAERLEGAVASLYPGK